MTARRKLLTYRDRIMSAAEPFLVGGSSVSAGTQRLESSLSPP